MLSAGGCAGPAKVVGWTSNTTDWDDQFKRPHANFCSLLHIWCGAGVRSAAGCTCSETLKAGFRSFTAAQSLCLVAIWLAFADLWRFSQALILRSELLLDTELWRQLHVLPMSFQ